MSQSNPPSVQPITMLLNHLQHSRKYLTSLSLVALLTTLMTVGAGLLFLVYPLQWRLWLYVGTGTLLLGGLTLGMTVYLLRRWVIQPLTRLDNELQRIDHDSVSQPSSAIAKQRPESAVRQPGVVDQAGTIAALNSTDIVDSTGVVKDESSQPTRLDDPTYYRRLVESSPDGIVIHREDEITFVNEAGAKILKASSPEKLIGQSMKNFVPADDWPIVQKRIQRVREDGRGTPLVEEKLIRLDGITVDVEVARFPFVFQGSPAVQLVIHDIADRKRTQAEIIQRNRELTILQSTGAAITSSLDLRYVLDTVAQEMTKLFEVESCAIFAWNQAEDSIAMIARYGSRGWWDPKSPAQVRQLTDYPLTKWALDQQIPQQMTISQTNIDPAEFAYMKTANVQTRMLLPMVFQQQVVGLVELEDTRVERNFAYQEISLAKLLSNQAANAVENARLFEQAQQEIGERKRAEAALEEERALLAQRVADRTAQLSRANAELARAARLKDEFLANMSHELRTPLNGILGSSEILQTGTFGEINDRQLRYLRNIEESGRHLLSLITDILDLAKSEAGRLELDIRPVSVAEVCEASLRLTKQLAHKKRLKVSPSIDKNVTKLSADERRLKQILVNLLSNAIKFTPEGGQIGLEVVGDEAEEVAHFTVWDTGIGIAQEDLKWLFRPFVQVDSSLARQYEGTGLGLSLVSRMVELHRGSVAVESEVGQGSRFTVSLPWPRTGDGEGRTEAGEDTSESPGLLPIPQAADSAKRRLILLAEDNEDNINTFLDYLQIYQYRVVVARNGQEAIDRVREEKPDLILMDVQMPGMDGLEATRYLRTDATLDDVPIVALTALAMPGDREQCLEAGASEYLSKPVSLKKLVQTIETQLH